MIRQLFASRRETPQPPDPDPGPNDGGEFFTNHFRYVREGGTYWTGWGRPLRCAVNDPGIVDPEVHGPGPYPPLRALMSEDGKPASIFEPHEHDGPSISVRVERWSLLRSGRVVRTWGGFVDFYSRRVLAEDASNR